MAAEPGAFWAVEEPPTPLTTAAKPSVILGSLPLDWEEARGIGVVIPTSPPAVTSPLALIVSA